EITSPARDQFPQQSASSDPPANHIARLTRNKAFSHNQGHQRSRCFRPHCHSCPLRSDCVAKLFWPSERVRLIQVQASIRNVDSRNHSLGFDCCVFLFYSFCTATLQHNPPRADK